MADNHVHYLPRVLINENNKLFFNGCYKAGYKAEQFPLNLRGCRGSSLCNLGCPNAAKMGTNRVQLPDAALLAERLRQGIERCRLPRRAGALFFTISVGAVEASEGDDMRKILERGRAALQAAVNQGRNSVCAQDVLGQPVPVGHS